MRQEQVNIIFIQSSKKVSSSRDIHSNENHSLLGNPLILPQIQILISFWSQKTEKQKFDIKENVMSELVKMPVRHFLRSDYLHIFFYIKFLLFVSLVHQISIWELYFLQLFVIIQHKYRYINIPQKYALYIASEEQMLLKICWET